MQTIRLGRTNLQVARLGFGALPIQRLTLEEAGRILRRAFDAGVNFYDTARVYTDSEEKIATALSPVRKKIIIATKAAGEQGEKIFESLETSLRTLKTDYVDLFQIHNPKTVPLPDDGTGRYEALLAAQQAGKTRFIGLTAHSLDNALKAVDCNLYDTVQFPFSILSTSRDQELPARCKAADVGFIAMKALAGGLLRDIAAAFAFMRRYDNVVPIWGIQRPEELEEFLALEKKPPAWDAAMEQSAERERAALGKEFCRGCGYCLPCPADIPISTAARMLPLLARNRWEKFVSPEWREKMGRIEQCTECRACAERCPYGLDCPALLRKQYEGYKAFVAGKKALGLIQK